MKQSSDPSKQSSRPSLSRAAALLALALPALAQDPAEPDDAPAPPPQRTGGADPSEDAFSMGSPAALPDGMAEEDMWPAASAEGWAQPCLVTWQRTFADALSVAQARHAPILVCVNMDGEIASEHFAGVRYRDAETAALMEDYVCIVASVYRHTPRDYDKNGQRVECPRFGTVTCHEHIEAERELYEKYFDGQRVAPRHIVLDDAGNEDYDVYFSWDTKTVFTTFVKGREGWPDPQDSVEPTIDSLSASAAVEHRQELERIYREGDRETKREVLQTLVKHRVVDQTEVLRTAIFGFDLEHAKLARRALAECETEDALDLIAEALKVPLDAAEREMLLDAVRRMGETSPRARTLAALHGGLSRGSNLIELADRNAIAREYEANASRNADAGERAAAAERADDPAAKLELAEALLALAREDRAQDFRELRLQDAESALREAEALGGSSTRLAALQALVADQRGDTARAHRFAIGAVEDGLLKTEAASPDELRVLQLFASARSQAIRNAFRAGDEWPPEWLSDVNAAYAVLAESPLSSDMLLVEEIDFLRWIGATPRADVALENALARYPDSPLLHQRLRWKLLFDEGPEGLERAYQERLERTGAEETQITWFAAYASYTAAEHHRRRGEFDDALAAYTRALDHWTTNVELFPDGRESAAHYMALAQAGSARVRLERGDLERATDLLLAALALGPDSAATQDGLGFSPVMTAKMLEARLKEAGLGQRASEVRAALESLDPRMLEPPPIERNVRRGGARPPGR